ncbi:equilibrative nucleobase transporter 1-like [Diadema antillarum]|uniref:equilibrative nucleobase transporter 1-like n=1 Tax=Diadema antillarum TaxID=105358 RepID=UPI003A85BAEC
MSPCSPSLRAYLLLVLGVVENLLNGGLIFGWPSLVFVLKESHYYSHLCIKNSSSTDFDVDYNDGDVVKSGAIGNFSPIFSEWGSSNTTTNSAAAVCPAQDVQLQLVFSVSSAVLPLAMLPAGAMLDRFGTRWTRIAMSFILLTGYLFMGFSSPGRAYFLFLGSITFTIGGTIALFSTLQIGNLFKGHRFTMINLMNGSYSTSLIVFFIIKIAYESGISMQTSFFIMAASTPVFTITTCLLPKDGIKWPPLPDEKYVEASDKAANGHPAAQIAMDMLSCDSDIVDGESEIAQAADEDNESVVDCVKSTTFWLILVWMTILQLDMTFAFGALNHILSRLAEYNNEKVGSYTNVFSIIQSFSLVVGALGGVLIDRKARSKPPHPDSRRGCRRNTFAELRTSCLPLALITLLAVGYSICLLVPSLLMQYVTAIFMLFMRSMLYGVGAAVSAIAFRHNFATVYGLIRALGGVCLLLQYPLFTFIQRHLQGDPFFEKRLNTFHLRCLRRLLHIKWQDRVTNAEVLQRAGILSMFSLLGQRRLKWLGHVRRMEPGRIPKDNAVWRAKRGVSSHEKAASSLQRCVQT